MKLLKLKKNKVSLCILSVVSMIFLSGTQINAQELSMDTIALENYVIITKENEDSIASCDYDYELNITYSEIMELYSDYTEANISAASIQSENTTKDSLEGFLQYAIDNGIIENTAEERAAFSKAYYRSQFKLAVAAGNTLGYTTAAALLDHSLQDNPSNFICDSSTTYASQILNSEEGQAIINSFKTSVEGTSVTTKHMSGSTTLNSTTDLHLAYNNVNYVVFGAKMNGTWEVSITVTDTYDFKKEDWENAMTDSAIVTMINNYAYDAQQAGAIVPYSIRITAKTTF